MFVTCLIIFKKKYVFLFKINIIKIRLNTFTYLLCSQSSTQHLPCVFYINLRILTSQFVQSKPNSTQHNPLRTQSLPPTFLLTRPVVNGRTGTAWKCTTHSSQSKLTAKEVFCLTFSHTLRKESTPFSHVLCLIYSNERFIGKDVSS